MYLKSLICALLCTVGICLVALLIKWVIVQVSVEIFVIMLVGFSGVFLLVGGNEDG